MKKLQAERGERLGGRPPYGYKKADRESKELVPDDEAAAVVQRIFSLCASGKGPNQIARILREEKVLTPSNYYYRNHEKSHAKLDLTRPYAWSSSTVTGILDNKVYLGHTVGLRTTTISYKNKTTVPPPRKRMRRCGKYASRADHAGAMGYRSRGTQAQETHTKVDGQSRISFRDSPTAPTANGRWCCTGQAV